MAQQPVGPLTSAGTASAPSKTPLNGRFSNLVPLENDHSSQLFDHLGGEEKGYLWTYMLSGPYLDKSEWDEAVDNWIKASDPFFYTVFSGPSDDPHAEAVGMMTYLNIVPGQRRVEIGSIILGEKLKQTKAATEAFFLLIAHAFEELGYLRVEWKANNLNKPSLSAAERLGFVFEGVFRKHMIIKGRQRDTAWFSITDEEWPVVKRAFQAWLADDNFDGDGRQIKGLRDIRAALEG